MAGRKKHSAEDAVRKLRRADELAAASKTNEEIAAELEVSAATPHNWGRLRCASRSIPRLLASSTASVASDLAADTAYRVRYREAARGLIGQITRPVSRSAATHGPWSVSIATGIGRSGCRRLRPTARVNNCVNRAPSLPTRPQATAPVVIDHRDAHRCDRSGRLGRP
ncbi:MAG TPA: hypothetical protein VKI44_05645 [Acetobacteraceae bacterium]|nr:hypothetical protein [Acetobacteraceae bacterium]